MLCEERERLRKATTPPHEERRLRLDVNDFLQWYVSEADYAGMSPTKTIVNVVEYLLRFPSADYYINSTVDSLRKQAREAVERVETIWGTPEPPIGEIYGEPILDRKAKNFMKDNIAFFDVLYRKMSEGVWVNIYDVTYEEYLRTVLRHIIYLFNIQYEMWWMSYHPDSEYRQRVGKQLCQVLRREIGKRIIDELF